MDSVASCCDELRKAQLANLQSASVCSSVSGSERAPSTALSVGLAVFLSLHLNQAHRTVSMRHCHFIIPSVCTVAAAAELSDTGRDCIQAATRFDSTHPGPLALIHKVCICI